MAKTLFDSFDGRATHIKYDNTIDRPRYDPVTTLRTIFGMTLAPVEIALSPRKEQSATRFLDRIMQKYGLTPEIGDDPDSFRSDLGVGFHKSVKMSVTSSGSAPDAYRTSSINRCAANSTGYSPHVLMMLPGDAYLSSPAVGKRRAPTCLEHWNGTGLALPEPMNGLRCCDRVRFR